MQPVESNDSFYLGKKIDLKEDSSSAGELFSCKSKDLTTHAVCVGMTGSGKTGLGIDLLEEAGLDGIPAIIIDPKGDLTNLMLTFPELSAEEFKPWIDSDEASKEGLTLDQYAEKTAKKWRDGLELFGEGKERIKRLRQNVEIEIYTPGSRSGKPISILNSFAAPPAEERENQEAFQEKVQSVTSSLLGLVGANIDPIKSREHILVATLLTKYWKEGKDLDLPKLIQLVQKPPFEVVGALPLETFYPAKDRMELSVSLNNLLASPGFQVWMEGAPLDTGKLLFTESGKPKLSVVTIMHLSDKERMFFVTLLLNEVLTWMRRQPGSSSLKALLYMDEIFGFFPPTAAPPSKLPMITLLKQARAYGLGVVLVTQNPVDLDYKGLSNCGMWFIGKLQTERDKARVLEGLKIASNGDIDAKELNQAISAIKSRVFLLRSVYQKAPILFETRWTLSFLKGPLTLSQISKLSFSDSKTPSEEKSVSEEGIRPAIPVGINEVFLQGPGHRPIRYSPRVFGIAKLHFVDTKNKIDVWREVALLASSKEGDVDWGSAENIPHFKEEQKDAPDPGASFDALPQNLTLPKNYASFEKQLAALLYQDQTLTLFESASPALLSNPGESKEDFSSRLNALIAERLDESTRKIKDKYEEKIATLKNRLSRYEGKWKQKQQKAWIQKIQTALSFLVAIIGAFFGKGVTKGTISQTGTSLRRAGQISKDSQEASQAEEDFNALSQQIDDLEEQKNKEISDIQLDKSVLGISELSLRPRKNDIFIEKIGLAWIQI